MRLLHHINAGMQRVADVGVQDAAYRYVLCAVRKTLQLFPWLVQFILCDGAGTVPSC
jgi:hypothetical protein